VNGAVALVPLVVATLPRLKRALVTPRPVRMLLYWSSKLAGGCATSACIAG
jgi:hypothetical protein